MSPDIVKQMLLILRNIEMQPLAGDKVNDCYKNQVQIVKTLKMCMLLNKNLTHIAITVVKDINKDPKPFDLIILLVIFAGTIRQKNAESLWKQNVRCGFYRTSLLSTLYNDYIEVCICIYCKRKIYKINCYLVILNLVNFFRLFKNYNYQHYNWLVNC